jgi:hypothetical protein
MAIRAPHGQPLWRRAGRSSAAGRREPPRRRRTGRGRERAAPPHLPPKRVPAARARVHAYLVEATARAHGHDRRAQGQPRLRAQLPPPVAAGGAAETARVFFGAAGLLQLPARQAPRVDGAGAGAGATQLAVGAEADPAKGAIVGRGHVAPRGDLFRGVVDGAGRGRDRLGGGGGGG